MTALTAKRPLFHVHSKKQPPIFLWIISVPNLYSETRAKLSPRIAFQNKSSAYALWDFWCLYADAPNIERPHTALDKRSPDDAFFDTEKTQKGGMKLTRLHLS